MGLDVYLYQKKFLNYTPETKTSLIEEKLLWEADTFELGMALVNDFLPDGRGVCLAEPEELEQWCKDVIYLNKLEEDEIEKVVELQHILQNNLDEEADLEIHETH